MSSSVDLRSAQWRMLSTTTRLPQLPKGVDAFWNSMIGKIRQRCAFRFQLMNDAKKILKLSAHYEAMSYEDLSDKLLDMKQIFRCKRETKQDLIHAFAMIREVSGRKLGMRHYKVQLAGAMAIIKNYITEMATGEGKTLTIVIPTVIQAWRGKGCHVLTSNSYLAKRDAQEMTQVYDFCHATVAWIEPEFEPQERAQAYAKDITYCTNQDVTADYLRDQLSLGDSLGLERNLLNKLFRQSDYSSKLIMRGLNAVIVDEADSILIDDGITPLIISGEAPNPLQVNIFKNASEIADKLDESDYKVSFKHREIILSNKAKKKIKAFTVDCELLKNAVNRREELVIQALKARKFYTKDKQYIIEDGKIVIVDESTGRLMPDRTWRHGMHQAIEAKEQLEINLPKDTYARISFQKFFRMYAELSGVTGTAYEARSEFWQIYKLLIMRIPTHRKCIRKQRFMRVFSTNKAKLKAVIKSVKKVNAKDRPILIGTAGIKESLELSEMLNEVGLEHKVLNAVNHQEEAEIVSRAGQTGAITISTNMAGRGTDIKLTTQSKEAGGLHVISTERFVSKRIDRQLYGRSSRQGDPGSAQAFVSMDDILLKENCPYSSRMLKFITLGLNVEISNFLIRDYFSLVQNKAMKKGRKQRKSVLENDTWMEENMGFTGQQ